MSNIANVRPSINNRPPKQPEFLKNRQKQEKMKERKSNIYIFYKISNQFNLERAEVIHYENKKLLSKMMEIERKPSQLNPLKLTKSIFQISSKTLNSGSRINGLKRINSENLVKIEIHHNVNNNILANNAPITNCSLCI